MRARRCLWKEERITVKWDERGGVREPAASKFKLREGRLMGASTCYRPPRRGLEIIFSLRSGTLSWASDLATSLLGQLLSGGQYPDALDWLWRVRPA